MSATEAAMMFVPAKWYSSPRFTLAQKPASAARSDAKIARAGEPHDITGLDAELREHLLRHQRGSLVVEVMVRFYPRIDVRNDDARTVGVGRE